MEGILSIIVSFILFISPGDSKLHPQLVCPKKFQPVGRLCYHFSEDHKPWKEARKACEILGETGHNLNVMLATLDITGDPQDNQDLLTAIRDKNSKYWMGGHMTGEDDKAHWNWLDNRPIHMTAPYWREKAPNNTEGNECTLVSTHSKHIKNAHIRASLTDNDCTKDYKYICQADCPKGFQLVGKYCYYFSSENNISDRTWDDARKFCQGESSDLAVLGLDIYNDQKMLDIIANAGASVWLGGSDRDADNHWFWLDGRPIPLVSYMWDTDAPHAASVTHNVLIAKVITTAHHLSEDKRAVLDDATSSEERQFICQLLYTPTNGQIYVEVETGQVVIPATGQAGQEVTPATGGTGQVVITANGQAGQVVIPPTGQTGRVVIPATGQAGHVVIPATGRMGQVGIPTTVRAGQVVIPATGEVSTVEADGIVQSIATIAANGKMQTVPLVQTLHAVPAVAGEGTVQYTATTKADGKSQSVPIFQTFL